MANREPPTFERLHQAVEYRTSVGGLFWLKGANPAAVPSRRIGEINNSGYRTVRVDGYRTTEHRLVWFYHTGQWPEKQIDHIDGNRTNNRIENLREATNAQNSQNMTAKKNGTGFAGVHKNKVGKYYAQIMTNYQKRNIGPYNTPEEAHAAYVAEKAIAHPYWSQALPPPAQPDEGEKG